MWNDNCNADKTLSFLFYDPSYFFLPPNLFFYLIGKEKSTVGASLAMEESFLPIFIYFSHQNFLQMYQQYL